jgi:hypothetical protein
MISKALTCLLLIMPAAIVLQGELEKQKQQQ